MIVNVERSGVARTIADPKSSFDSFVYIAEIESDCFADLDVWNEPLRHPVFDCAFFHPVVVRQFILAQRTPLIFKFYTNSFPGPVIFVLLHAIKNVNQIDNDLVLLRPAT